MKKIFIIINIIIISEILSQNVLPPKFSFMQANNINSIFYNNGIYNYDKFTFPGGEAGFVWPVTSATRLTADFATGFWIGAKVGSAGNLRLAACYANSHYTAGNIPLIGQVPPVSVCNDSTWKVYLVNLNDPSLINGGTRTKVAGGRTYTFYYSSWAQWPISKGAPFAEINGIPGYQPGWNSDRPGIGNGSKVRPEEICFTVFMDYTNCTNDTHYSEISLPGGTLPLGVEVQQTVFAFNCPKLNNMLFIKYRFINKSLLLWDSTFVSIFNDVDLGFSSNDAGGCDSIRNLSLIYNKTVTDPDYGMNPPVLGSRLLQRPVIYTGINNDTAYLPYDTLIGYKMLRMSGTFILLGGANECFGDPDEAFRAYYFMQGKDGCGRQLINWVTGQPTTFMFSGNACAQIGWIDSAIGGHDVRYIQNTGPFTMNSRDTQVVVAAFIITRDGGTNFQNVCALQSLSDSALKYYYNDFRTCIPIGIEPISNEVPDRFMLYQNYPNPFNPITKIKFAVPPSPKGEGLGVRVIIYDILGREIATLVNEELKPGTYEVEWDAANYPSGVYFYQLTAPGFTQTNKMVLLK